MLSLWVDTLASDWQRTLLYICVQQKEKINNKVHYQLCTSDIRYARYQLAPAQIESTYRTNITYTVNTSSYADPERKLVQHKEVLLELNNLLHVYLGGQNSPSTCKIPFPEFFLQLQIWNGSVGVCGCARTCAQPRLTHKSWEKHFQGNELPPSLSFLSPSSSS